MNVERGIIHTPQGMRRDRRPPAGGRIKNWTQDEARLRLREIAANCRDVGMHKSGEDLDAMADQFALLTGFPVRR